MTDVANLTHDEIAEVGARWLRGNGFSVAFANMISATNGEQPDALGVTAFGETFLLEAKVSRSDFWADKNKPWRRDGAKALGGNRGYITPKGLLKPDEVPYGWWLLEVHGKTKPIVKVIKGKRMVQTEEKWCGKRPSYPNCTPQELMHFKQMDNPLSCDRQALTWMVKVIRRAIDDGLNLEQYARQQSGGGE